MLTHKDIFHGSDLEKIEAVYGIKKEDIVSFSANVNPLGISYKLRETLAKNLDAITSYPDREYRALRSAIASYAETETENVIVGNGSTELISLFLQTQHPKKAIIVGPTYSEYEREIALSGGSSVYYPLLEEQDFSLRTSSFCASLTDKADLAVICNPNNPTSTAISRTDLRRILDTCMTHGIFVMIDETYVEFADDGKEITAVPLCNSYNNLIVLRGTSKFFAAPGLRLGYAITGNADIREAIRSRQNPWSINSLAEIAGRLMFSDEDYIKETKELIRSERSRMTEALGQMKTVKVFRPEANFLLFRIEKPSVTSDQLFDHCIRKGLMIRDCQSFPFLDDRFIRFCFMKPADNDRLLAAFRELL